MANNGGDHEVVSLGGDSTGTRGLHAPAAYHNHDDDQYDDNDGPATAAPSGASRRFRAT